MSRALYYALGGGLGHITRARTFLHQFGLRATVLASAAPQPATTGMDLLTVPAELPATADALADWLQRQLRRLRPDTLYLDSFPAGLLGELSRVALPADLRIHHLARLLRWPDYAPLLGENPPRLHRVHRLEPLQAVHEDWLRGQADEIQDLTLSDLPGAHDPAAADTFAALPRPRWLVVHSGPAEEIDELLDYARQQARCEDQRPSLTLISPRAPTRLRSGEQWLPCYPASPLFPQADRIVTACGFNTMYQTLPYRDRHRFLPLPRRYDDQYARAALARGDADQAAAGGSAPPGNRG